jgi:prevent-host-death family protein
MYVMGKTHITGGCEMNVEASEIKRIPGKRLTPSQFRRKMGDYLARVQYGNETLVIATRGKRHAVICPPGNWCSTETRKR